MEDPVVLFRVRGCLTLEVSYCQQQMCVFFVDALGLDDEHLIADSFDETWG